MNYDILMYMNDILRMIISESYLSLNLCCYGLKMDSPIRYRDLLFFNYIFIFIRKIKNPKVTIPFDSAMNLTL